MPRAVTRKRKNSSKTVTTKRPPISIQQPSAAGGLFADLYAIAQVRRAESLARVGKLDEALEILAKEEGGSPNLAEIHQIRAFIFAKQGRTGPAAQEFRKARGYDPQN